MRYDYTFKAYDIRKGIYVQGNYKCDVAPSCADERLTVLRKMSDYLKNRNMSYFIPLYITEVKECLS